VVHNENCCSSGLRKRNPKAGKGLDPGDGAYIGAGAKILGGVRIGRGATVGANAVITKDAPAGATVAGANRLLPKRSPYALD
jgi:serine acetyltransferase